MLSRTSPQSGRGSPATGSSQASWLKLASTVRDDVTRKTGATTAASEGGGWACVIRVEGEAPKPLDVDVGAFTPILPGEGKSNEAAFRLVDLFAYAFRRVGPRRWSTFGLPDAPS